MGRRKKGEDDSTIKSRLVDRMGEQLFTRGFGNYTMDGVSQTFGVSKKTLYRFFPTKEDMILQVARLFVSRIKAYIEKRIARIESGGPEEFVPRIMEFIGKIGSILLSLPISVLADLEKKSPVLFDRIDALRSEVIMSLFSRIMDVGKRMGKVREDIDSEIASHIYAGMIRQIASRQGLGPAYAPYDVFLTAIKIMFGGILTEEAKPELSTSGLPRYSSSDPWEEIKREAGG
jgi:AcrR family transcriptional regulator